VSSDKALLRISSDEFLYLALRIVAIGIGLVLHFANYIPVQMVAERQMSLWAFALVSVTTLVVIVAVARFNTPVPRLMMRVLPFDAFAIAMLAYVTSATDPFFAVCVLLVILYGTIVSFRETVLASAVVSFAYALGHVAVPENHMLTIVLFGVKTVFIAVVGIIVGISVDRRRRHEQEVANVAREHEMVSDQLKRRFAELQAISRITELVHSTLDFDEVGHEVVDILSKAIDVGALCIFVLDKEKSQTLFSASVGLDQNSDLSGVDPYAIGDLDSHLSCVSVFEHGDMMVLLCAAEHHIAGLTEDDHLVIQAVTGEIVVAVENSQLYKLTRRLSVTDELTSMYNYRYLQQRLDEEVVRAKRYSKYLSLLMIDVDDFKGFNDSYGHIAGDVALSELRNALAPVVRQVDVVTRYGGEEFAILLPETDDAGAFVAAEKIREAVAAYDFANAQGERCVNLTVSLGIATFPTCADDKEGLLREADDALYRAKNGGRNRVRAPRVALEPERSSGE
jgi:diguanylate cyclase (GGDEF)-like protein